MEDVYVIGVPPTLKLEDALNLLLERPGRDYKIYEFRNGKPREIPTSELGQLLDVYVDLAP